MSDKEDAIFSEVSEKYMPRVMEDIRKKASDMASSDDRVEIDFVDAFRAFDEFFVRRTIEKEEPKYYFWRENSFVIVIMTLTLLFGAMGLVPYINGSAKTEFKPDTFLDIAKLFAGVIVGGAAGAAAASVGRRPPSR